MQFSPEVIAGRTFPVVAEGYDPIAVAAFLREVADDYTTLLTAASYLLEAVSPVGGDGQDGGSTSYSRSERRHLKRLEVASARLLLEAKVDAAELLREASSRIDRVLAMEQAMLELLRMARDGIENLEQELHWPEWIQERLSNPHPADNELEAQSTNGPLGDRPKSAVPEGESDR
jgi:DivIVA domain-containing protein